MPKTIQFVYPMGKVVIPTYKMTSQLNNTFKHARHFKPSEYLSYFRLDVTQHQISEFPLYNTEEPNKIYTKEYTSLFSELDQNKQEVPYSKLSKAEDAACFIVAANYWPVEIHNFPQVCRVPMFFQAQDITELKLRLITFICDLGHNKKALDDCKPFLFLIELRTTGFQNSQEEGENCQLSQLPVSIKPILHTNCCSMPLLTAEGAVQVSDVPLSRIKQEMEDNNRTLVILDYSADKSIQLHSESNLLLSECQSAPLILRQNEIILVFDGEFIASRAEKNCFQYKKKKIAYKVSENLTPKQIAQFLQLNVAVFDISERTCQISESKSEIKVKIIAVKKNYWKYDTGFYKMILTNCLGLQTIASEILAGYHYFANNQLLYAVILITFSVVTITGRFILVHLKKQLRWYSIFTIILNLDRFKETYESWSKFGNKVTPFFNGETIQLYLQTCVSLFLAILAQLMSDQLKWVLLFNILLSSASACMGLSTVRSCCMPLEFDPRKNPWDSPYYGVLFEKKYDENFIWKMKQITQLLLEISSRCFVLCVVLIKEPIAFGVFLYAYFFLEAAYSLKNIHAPTIVCLACSVVAPPIKSFATRDLAFVSYTQLKHMMKKDLLNPEMLILERYYHTHILVKIVRTTPFLACIIYLLNNENYLSQTDAQTSTRTYAVLIGFAFTAVMLLIYVYDCLVLRYFAKIERKKKFALLDSKRTTYFYKNVSLDNLLLTSRAFSSRLESSDLQPPNPSRIIIY